MLPSSHIIRGIDAAASLKQVQRQGILRAFQFVIIRGIDAAASLKRQALFALTTLGLRLGIIRGITAAASLKQFTPDLTRERAA